MYGLTAEDLRIRDTAREFVETLIPYEVEAELAGGQLPKEITAEHHARAIELGLYATNMPDVGRRSGIALRCNRFWCRSRCGRVTNAIGVGDGTRRRSGGSEVATDYQRERWLLPGGARREARGLRHHRGVRRLGRLRAGGHRPPRGRRVRDQRGQVARHLVQPGRLRVRPGGPDRRPARAATTCCWSSTCRGRAWKWFARRTIRTTSPTSIRSCRSPMSGCRWRIWWAPRARG